MLISAPGDGADKTIVYGVNHDVLTKDDLIVSNASCTTNCLSPVAYVLNDAIGIEKGMMTTIHSYTGDQPTLDTMHKDLYRGRAAALSMIPTSYRGCQGRGSGAARVEGQAGRLCHPRADSERVGRGSEVHRQARDLALRRSMPRSRRPLTWPAEGHSGLYAVQERLVDFNHDPHSSVFHMDQTKVMDGTFCSILSWYDNEWGFSNRMADTAVAMGKLI